MKHQHSTNIPSTVPRILTQFSPNVCHTKKESRTSSRSCKNISNVRVERRGVGHKKLELKSSTCEWLLTKTRNFIPRLVAWEREKTRNQVSKRAQQTHCLIISRHNRVRLTIRSTDYKHRWNDHEFHNERAEGRWIRQESHRLIYPIRTLRPHRPRASHLNCLATINFHYKPSQCSNLYFPLQTIWDSVFVEVPTRKYNNHVLHFCNTPSPFQIRLHFFFFHFGHESFDLFLVRYLGWSILCSLVGAS